MYQEKKITTKLIDSLKLKNYFYIPFEEPIYMDNETIKKGEKAVLRKLIYLGVSSIFNHRNEINASILKEVYLYYDLHWYKDTNINKHPHTHIRTINGINFLSSLDEDEYIDQIELAANDFHVKNTLRTTFDNVLNEFQALFKSDCLDVDFKKFSENYLSQENLHIEIRHESKNIDNYKDAYEFLLRTIRSFSKYDPQATRAHFVGNRCKPYYVLVYVSSSSEKHYGLGRIEQEGGRRGIYVVGLHAFVNHFFLFDLDDNNKVNKITIIRDNMLNLYNIAYGDPDEDM